MKLIINKFEELRKEEQEDIQDFIAGYTPNVFIVEKNECDVCSKKRYLHRVETEEGIIRVCTECLKNGRKI
jgi:hypothetical protein